MQTAYARLYAGQGELLNKIGSTRQGLPGVSRETYMDAVNVCEAIAPEQVTIDKAALLADAKPLSVMTAAAPKPVPTSTCSTEAVTARVNDWADAWRHKDYDTYSKFYADKFTPEPSLSRYDWAKQCLSTSGKINLDLSNMQVTCNGDKANAVFDQDYSVTTYKLLKKPKDAAGCEVCAAKRVATKGFADKVNKTLQLEKSGGANGSQWQIVRELTNK